MTNNWLFEFISLSIQTSKNHDEVDNVQGVYEVEGIFTYMGGLEGL